MRDGRHPQSSTASQSTRDGSTRSRVLGFRAQRAVPTATSRPAPRPTWPSCCLGTGCRRRLEPRLRVRAVESSTLVACHRAVQNQPLVGDSKPASLRCGFHNSYGCWIKGFGSRINEPGTAASPSSRPRRSTVPSTWSCSPLAGMATASP